MAEKIEIPARWCTVHNCGDERETGRCLMLLMLRAVVAVDTHGEQVELRVEPCVFREGVFLSIAHMEANDG